MQFIRFNIKKIIKRLVERAKNSTIFIFIGIILFLFSSVITISQGEGVIRGLYHKTDVGYKNQLLDKFSKLNAGINVGIFIEKFGSPTFKTKKENTDIYEYIFLDDKYYYLQVLTDSEGTVLAYSITTRDENFNPVILIPSQKNKVVLGKTKFIDLGEPDKIISRLGVHDFYYSESYYYGNPGFYQTYYFTQNEMGYINKINTDSQNFHDFDFERDDMGKIKDDMKSSDDDIAYFRENSVVNTFTVAAPLISLNSDLSESIQFGPDKYMVRVIE